MFLPGSTAWQVLHTAKTFSPASTVPVNEASLVPSSVSMLSAVGFAAAAAGAAAGSVAAVSVGAAAVSSAGFCEQAETDARAKTAAVSPKDARIDTIRLSNKFIDTNVGVAA